MNKTTSLQNFSVTFATLRGEEMKAAVRMPLANES
jgi:hypothetical protein